MATLTLRPTGTASGDFWVSNSGWTTTPSGGGPSRIADDPDSHDGDTTNIRSAPGASATLRAHLTDTPADFSSMDSFTLRVTAKTVNWADDQMTLKAFLVQGSEITMQNETNFSRVASAWGTTYTTWEQSFTPRGTVNNKADWDDARLALNLSYSTSMGADDAVLHITAVEVNGVYTQTPNAPVITAPADFATINGVTSLQATVSDPSAANVRAEWELWADRPAQVGETLQSFAAPGGTSNGLASDGTSLWCSDNDSDTIYKLNPSSGAVISSFASPGITPLDLEWDGTNLWCVDDSSDLIYKLNPSTGSIISSFAATNAYAFGLAWDGANLWQSEFNTGVIYKLDPSNGAVITSFTGPGTVSGVRGLAWDGTNLWCSNVITDTIYKLNPSTGAVISSFATVGGGPRGLAWDGTNLWNTDTDTDLIYKLANVTDVGSTTQSFASPSTTPSGVTWDGTNLWSCDYTSDLIYKHNPSTGAVISSFAAPNTNPQGITWDGTNLWVCDQTAFRVYKVNPSTGATISDFASPGIGNPRGIAWDGTNLWVGEPGADKVHKVNPSTGAVISAITVASMGTAGSLTIGGVEWYQDNLLVSDLTNDMIYTVNPSTGAIVSTYKSPSTTPLDLAWDGANLWHCDSDSDFIYKLNHKGTSNDTGSSLVQDIAPNATTVTSGTTHTTSWDASSVPDQEYKLRAWTWNASGISSATYDEHTVTVGDPTVTHSVDALLYEHIAPIEIQFTNPAETVGEGSNFLAVRARTVGADVARMYVEVFESGVFKQRFIDALTTTFTNYNYEITESIADYSNVTLKISANVSGTTTPVQVSWMEMVVPGSQGPQIVTSTITHAVDALLAQTQSAWNIWNGSELIPVTPYIKP